MYFLSYPFAVRFFAVSYVWLLFAVLPPVAPFLLYATVYVIAVHLAFIVVYTLTAPISFVFAPFLSITKTSVFP